MWLAVIIGVCLAVEVLTYLTGGEIRLGNKKEEVEAKPESSAEYKAPRQLAA